MSGYIQRLLARAGTAAQTSSGETSGKADQSSFETPNSIKVSGRLTAPLAQMDQRLMFMDSLDDIALSTTALFSEEFESQSEHVHRSMSVRNPSHEVMGKWDSGVVRTAADVEKLARVDVAAPPALQTKGDDAVRNEKIESPKPHRTSQDAIDIAKIKTETFEPVQQPALQMKISDEAFEREGEGHTLGQEPKTPIDIKRADLKPATPVSYLNDPETNFLELDHSSFDDRSSIAPSSKEITSKTAPLVTPKLRRASPSNETLPDISTFEVLPTGTSDPEIQAAQPRALNLSEPSIATDMEPDQAPRSDSVQVNKNSEDRPVIQSSTVHVFPNEPRRQLPQSAEAASVIGPLPLRYRARTLRGLRRRL